MQIVCLVTSQGEASSLGLEVTGIVPGRKKEGGCGVNVS